MAGIACWSVISALGNACGWRCCMSGLGYRVAVRVCAVLWRGSRQWRLPAEHEVAVSGVDVRMGAVWKLFLVTAAGAMGLIRTSSGVIRSVLIHSSGVYSRGWLRKGATSWRLGLGKGRLQKGPCPAWLCVQQHSIGPLRVRQHLQHAQTLWFIARSLGCMTVGSRDHYFMLPSAVLPWTWRLPVQDC